MYVKLEDGEVLDVKLHIYEPPRFFEAFLRGRVFTEAPDITARICGICPVAYQMSAVRAMEDACGVTIDAGPLRALRRLLYCGEWIESHSAARLHAARARLPRLRGRGRDGARSPRARRAGPADEEGRQRADGARRRPGDPPDQRARRGLLPGAPPQRAARRCVDPLRGGARDGTRDRPLGCHADVPRRRVRPRARRALRAGRLPDRPRPDRLRRAASTSRPRPSTSTSSRNTSSTPTRCTRACARAVPTSSARLPATRSPPPALRAPAGEAARAAGLGAVCRNPFRSIVVRAVELVHACDEALRDHRALRGARCARRRGHPPRARSATAPPRRRAACSTTATRSTRRAASSTRRSCRPTSQNQLVIEAGPARGRRRRALDLPDAQLALRCEQAIRNYDPCISCATHFLTLDVDRGG